jgi:hypothetical protein
MVIIRGMDNVHSLEQAGGKLEFQRSQNHSIEAVTFQGIASGRYRPLP